MANTNIDTYIAILLTFFILRCKMWGCAHFQLYTSPRSYDLIICWNNENDENCVNCVNSGPLEKTQHSKPRPKQVQNRCSPAS